MGNTNSKGNSAETAMFLFLGKRATEEILPSWLVLLLKKNNNKRWCVKKNDTDCTETIEETNTNSEGGDICLSQDSELVLPSPWIKILRVWQLYSYNLKASVLYTQNTVYNEHLECNSRKVNKPNENAQKIWRADGGSQRYHCWECEFTDKERMLEGAMW